MRNEWGSDLSARDPARYRWPVPDAPWRHISTAPKDGTQVIVYPNMHGPGPDISVEAFEADGVEFDGGWMWYYTHWIPVPLDGWRPMETAPRNGTYVLLACDDPTEPYGYGHWENYAEIAPEHFGPEPDWRWSKSIDGEPLRWQPLPVSPAHGLLPVNEP